MSASAQTCQRKTPKCQSLKGGPGLLGVFLLLLNKFISQEHEEVQHASETPKTLAPLHTQLPQPAFFAKVANEGHPESKAQTMMAQTRTLGQPELGQAAKSESSKASMKVEAEEAESSAVRNGIRNQRFSVTNLEHKMDAWIIVGIAGAVG